MAVHVDDMRARVGRMIMCHMMADSREELQEMAMVIGVSRRWLQGAHTPWEHYDVCMAMRARAVSRGAKQITTREMASFRRGRYEVMVAQGKWAEGERGHA